MSEANTTATPSRTEAWPSNRFYWSIIEGPARWCAGLLPPGLLAEAGDDFPIAIESLHAVGAADAEGRIVVCAVEHEALEALPSEVLSLRPREAPSGLDLDVSAFELLVGRWEPRPLRRRRTQKHLTLASAVLACALLITLGLARRAGHADRAATAFARQSAKAILATGIPEPQLQETIRERQALSTARRGAQLDAVPTLAALLAIWPTPASASVDSMTIASDRVLASVTLESDPKTFLEALTLPTGWRLDEPRLSSARSVTRLNLQLWTGEGP